MCRIPHRVAERGSVSWFPGDAASESTDGCRRSQRNSAAHIEVLLVNIQKFPASGIPSPHGFKVAEASEQLKERERLIKD